MKDVYIGLGSNKGDKQNNIAAAVSFIAERVGEVIQTSSIYRTPPWGFDSDQDFYNAIIHVQTVLKPLELLSCLKMIETDMGRQQRKDGAGYQDRIIDLDIIDYHGEAISMDQITIPHERMHERDFVLYPLQDLEKNWIHPVTQKTVFEYIQELENTSKISKL